MKQLIYASTAHPTVTLDDVQAILTTANKKNIDNEITGILVYNGTYFLQCLEGTEKNLQHLFGVIKKDNRHSDVRLLGIKEIFQRDFEDWHMGYINSSKVIEDMIKKESPYTTFQPYDFNYDNAKNILQKLSFLI